MRKLNISVPMLYKDKHGADKTKWVNIGNLVIGDDGKVFGEISSTPVGPWDGSFSCFDREDKQQPQQQYAQEQPQQYRAPQPQYQDASGRPITQQQYQQSLPQYDHEGRR